MIPLSKLFSFIEAVTVLRSYLAYIGGAGFTPEAHPALAELLGGYGSNAAGLSRARRCHAANESGHSRKTRRIIDELNVIMKPGVFLSAPGVHEMYLVRSSASSHSHLPRELERPE